MYRRGLCCCREVEEGLNKGKRKLSSKEQDGPSAKRAKSISTTTQGSSAESEKQHMQFFMMNICAGYSSLLHVFQYLKVQELLRATRVCRMWRDIASHASLVSTSHLFLLVFKSVQSWFGWLLMHGLLENFHLPSCMPVA